MKKLLVSTLFFLAANVSFANTHCVVNTGNNDGNLMFDQTLFSGELADNKLVLVSKDLKSAVEFDLAKVNSVEQWRAIEGQYIIAFSRTSGETIGISASRVDIGPSQKNMLPILALSIGELVKAKSTNLILPQAKLAASCLSF